MGITDCSPELILHIVSFLEIILDSEYSERDCPLGYISLQKLVAVPDLASINALSQTSTSFYHAIDETLYRLCASVDELGSLALLFAVEHQLEGTLDKLIAAGMSLDVVAAHHSIQCTSLHTAAHTGGLDMVVKLLGMCRAEMVHKHDADARMALDYAVHKGHLEIVKILVPIPIPSFIDRDGLVSNGRYLGDGLVESAVVGNLEISQYLIMAGADINHDRQGTCKMRGGTPLFHAAGSANLGLVQFLLTSGADPNLPTCFGSTPLFNAANMDIVRTLLAAGANIHTQNAGSENVLPKFMSDLEMLQFFLDRGVDPNHVDDDGETPLHHACWKSPSEIVTASVELLLGFGAATVETADHSGGTPVDNAMFEENLEVVKILEPLVENPLLQQRISKWWKKERTATALTRSCL